MPILTEERPQAHVETAQSRRTEGFEMNAFQTWVSSLPGVVGQLIAVGFIVIPLLILVVVIALLAR